MVALICCFGGTTVPRLIAKRPQNQLPALLALEYRLDVVSHAPALTIKSIWHIPHLKAKSCKNGDLKVKDSFSSACNK